MASPSPMHLPRVGKFGRALIQQHSLLKQQEEARQRAAEGVPALSSAIVSAHPLAGLLPPRGGRRRENSRVKLAQRLRLEVPDDTSSTSVDEDDERTRSVLEAEVRYQEYLTRLKHMMAMPVPPSGAELRRMHMEGIAIAKQHNELASDQELESSIRRACLMRALEAVPPPPLGSAALAETLYSIGCFHLQRGTTHKAIRFLRDSINAAGAEPNAATAAVSARLNLCVALQRADEQLLALHEAKAALAHLQGLPSDQICDEDRASFEGIARYNLMCCHEASGEHRSALEHARGAKKAIGRSSLPSVITAQLSSAAGAYREAHPSNKDDAHFKLSTEASVAAAWTRRPAADEGGTSVGLAPVTVISESKYRRLLGNFNAQRTLPTLPPARSASQQPTRVSSTSTLPTLGGKRAGATTGGRPLKTSDSAPVLPAISSKGGDDDCETVGGKTFAEAPGSPSKAPSPSKLPQEGIAAAGEPGPDEPVTKPTPEAAAPAEPAAEEPAAVAPAEPAAPLESAPSELLQQVALLRLSPAP